MEVSAVGTFDSTTMSKIQDFHTYMSHPEGCRVFTKMRIKEIAKTINSAMQNTTQQLQHAHLSSSALKERVLTLEEITEKKVLPPRKAYLHLLTLGISYYFVKRHDHKNAEKILGNRQILVNNYLMQLLAPTNTDPEKNIHILQILKVAGTQTRREVLKYALGQRDQALITKCRKLLENDGFMQKEWKAALKQLKVSPDLTRVRVLIEAGVNINAIVSGKTALRWAARYADYKEFVDLLIQAGADLEKPSRFGRSTPLSVAIQNHVPENAIALIRAGVDLSKPFFMNNNVYIYYDTPLHLMRELGNKEMITLIEQETSRRDKVARGQAGQKEDAVKPTLSAPLPSVDIPVGPQLKSEP